LCLNDDKRFHSISISFIASFLQFILNIPTFHNFYILYLLKVYIKGILHIFFKQKTFKQPPRMFWMFYFIKYGVEYCATTVKVSQRDNWESVSQSVTLRLLFFSLWHILNHITGVWTCMYGHITFNLKRSSSNFQFFFVRKIITACEARTWSTWIYKLAWNHLCHPCNWKLSAEQTVG
jgi:hypothetical protein